MITITDISEIKISFIFAALNLNSSIESTLTHLISINSNILNDKSEIIVVCVNDKNLFEKKFGNKISVYSDPGGISEAWNFALSKARGKYVNFTGDGDYLSHDAAFTLYEAITSDKEALIFNCNAIFFDSGLPVRQMKATNICEIGVFGTSVQTPCLFISKSILNEFRFSDNYRVAIDIDLIIKINKLALPLFCINAPVYIEENGISVTRRNEAFREYISILKSENYRYATIADYLIHFYSIYRFIKKINKSIVKNILRQAKHISIFIMNVIFNITPGGFCRNSLLRMSGISIKKGSSIRSMFRLYGVGNIKIGFNSVVNRGCILDNRGSIEIGDNVSIAHEVRIYTAGHKIKSPFFEMFKSNVIIGNSCAIFPGSIINPGVILKDGCVVLGGSVVYGMFEKDSVISGNPAKVIGKRDGVYRYSCAYSFRFAQ